MLVSEILKTKGGVVHAITPHATVSDACVELSRRKVGALVVCEGDRVAGVFSERDVVAAIATDGAAALTRPVADYMTRQVIYAEPGETVGALMSRMTDRRIRHLPILSGQHLIGVVSIGDLVKVQIAEAAGEAASLRRYISAG
jgi:CBS domain-containing protein